jgi:hypothetical protein
MPKFATGNGIMRAILWVLIDSQRKIRKSGADQCAHMLPLERMQERLRIPQVEH